MTSIKDFAAMATISAMNWSNHRITAWDGTRPQAEERPKKDRSEIKRRRKQRHRKAKS